MIHCAITEYSLKANGYNPQTQENIENYIILNSLSQIQKGKNNHIKNNIYMSKMKINSIHYSLRKMAGKIPSTLQR